MFVHSVFISRQWALLREVGSRSCLRQIVLDVPTTSSQELSWAAVSSFLLGPVCCHLGRSPSVPLHLSLCSVFLFVFWTELQKMKAEGWSLSLSFAGTQRHRDDRERGEQREACRVDLA